jgi:mannosyltransferase OCH1-like enzyme
MAFPLAGQNSNVNKMRDIMKDITADPEFKTYSPEVQQMLLFGGVLGARPSEIPTEEELQRMEGFREREARRAQELGKEANREAFKYSMLANIPKTIAQSFGNISAMNLYAGQSIPEAFSKTLANYPRAQFSSYQFQPEKYFD